LAHGFFFSFESLTIQHYDDRMPVHSNKITSLASATHRTSCGDEYVARGVLSRFDNEPLPGRNAYTSMSSAHHTVLPTDRDAVHPRRGMTMVEVMIAAVVLGFVIMTSLVALSQAYGYTRHARMVTLAGQVVQSVMEDLRLKNYSQITAYAAQTQPVSFSSTISTEGFQSNFTQGFVVSGQFNTLVASSAPTLGKTSVTLTVRWKERDNAFSRSLITYFGEKGLSDYYYVGWAP
jgi:prepilin-type N-terminal cleavage/methylation domain-containing protein